MYLTFDTETTGLPSNWKAPITDVNNWPRMVQVAWLNHDAEGNLINKHSHIIRPEGYRIPQGAARVHGITTERAMVEGEDLAEILQFFANDVANAEYLIAHNMSFDEKIIGAELIRKSIDHQLFSKNRLCTKELSTNYCAIPNHYGYKWPTLSELHIKLFGEDFGDAHDAFADAEATARSFFKLKELNVIKK